MSPQQRVRPFHSSLAVMFIKMFTSSFQRDGDEAVTHQGRKPGGTEGTRFVVDMYNKGKMSQKVPGIVNTFIMSTLLSFFLIIKLLVRPEHAYKQITHKSTDKHSNTFTIH